MNKNSSSPQYDFFIAHASADLHIAEALYTRLVDHARVFLDSKNLLPGDDWDVELSHAQRHSLITVVLVSAATEAAFYQRDEIAAAIAMARDNPPSQKKHTHRVIPVYLGEVPDDGLPYGLRLKHRITLAGIEGVDVVAKRLIDTVAILQQQCSVNEFANVVDLAELQRYRDQLMDHMHHVDLFYLKRLTGNAPFPIDQIYVPLKVNPRKLHSGQSVLDALHDEKLRYLPGEQRESRELADILSTLFGLPEYRCLIVLGKPGSGKTTLLKYLAYYFASGRQREISAEFTGRIPFYVRLKDIKEAAMSWSDTNDKHRDITQQQDVLSLAQAVINNLDMRGYRSLPTVLTVEAWLTENPLVLLDGLDEVADPGQRYQVAQWVKRQMKAHRHAHFVISSRLHGYSVDYVPDVSLTVEVDDFNSDLRYQFLQCWFAHVYRDRCARRQPPAWKAQTVAHQLADTIEQDNSQHLQDLAKNPLLLSMIAIVQLALLNRDPMDTPVTLPDVRTRLYDCCVALFIKEWQSNWDRARQVPVGAINEDTYRRLLQCAALRLQAAQSEGYAESARLVEANLLHYLADDLAGELDETLVRQCLHHSHERTLLLVEYAPGQWGFQHKTFQEYLAAEAVVSALQAQTANTEPLQIFVDHLGQDHWRVVFELFVEKIQSAPDPSVETFLAVCRQRMLADPRLAVSAWNWIEELYVKENFPFPASERCRLKHDVWRLLANSDNPIALCKFHHFLARELPTVDINDAQYRDRLDAVVVNSASSASSINSIHHVLLLPEIIIRPDDVLMNHLAGYLGVGKATPLSSAVALTLQRYDWGESKRLDHHLYVNIFADAFYRGSLKNEEDVYENEIDGEVYYLAGFQMSRYPVTNAQYQRFMDAALHSSGDDTSSWVFPHGGGHHPVVNVSWHDAQAYIAWLNQKEDGYCYSLPTEAQWERAAHGSAVINGVENRRRYPWGDTFDNTKCNTQESGLYRTTPVGCFPQGASQEGVLDMAGNVWEWCADCYSVDYYQRHTVAENKAKGNGWKVLRGGAFYYSSKDARSTVRSGNASVDASRSIGFRVVRAHW